MKKIFKEFDLMVVYSESVAHSSIDKRYKEATPFSSKNSESIYNDSYQYFLEYCQKNKIQAAFTTSSDIIGPELFKSYWTYNHKWIRNNHNARSNVLFDKFTPISKPQEKKLKLLRSKNKTYLFNKEKLTNIFQDKLNTYKNFPEFTIPTVEITGLTKSKINLAQNKLTNKLKNHINKIDFDNNFLIKDKTGAGGHRIFKVNFKEKNYFKEIKNNYKIDKIDKPSLEYILQAFIKNNQGFSFGKNSGSIDLRIILINHKIIQAYIRVAKKGNYKCNEHQGGNLIYISNKSIPQEVLKMSRAITKKLNKKVNLKNSLYALDFIKSNQGNIYFVEGNNNPGIDWNHQKKINEIKTKELIRHIVNELKSIIEEKKIN